MARKKRDPIRFWGVLGASALALAIVVALVVQTRAPKPQTASTQAEVKTQAAAKPQADAKLRAAVKPQTAAVKPQASAKPLTDAQRKTSEELWVEQKQLETVGARVAAATPDGRRRVAETIAKQFNVPEKLVDDLRGRKIGYGELTVAMALSQQLIKRDKVTPQQALEKVLGLRKSGHGWGVIARDLGLKLSDAVSAVKKTDKQLAKLDTGKMTKAAR
jgi:hypothetical protein